MATYRARLAKMSLVVSAVFLLTAVTADSQTKKPNKAQPSPLFQEAMAKAKKNKQPLVLFGVSEGCVRCAALKAGLTDQAEIKDLMGQYVSAEIPFGGKEFVAVFNNTVQQDKKYNQS